MESPNCAPSLLWTEEWISFAQAAKLFPPYRRGRPVSPSCVWRWFKTGVKTTDGRVVRLEALKLVNRHVTSADAIKRFMAAQQPPGEQEAALVPHTVPKGPRTRSPERRQRDSEKAAERIMKRAGRGN
jgi:hypothetical protein